MSHTRVWEVGWWEDPRAAVNRGPLPMARCLLLITFHMPPPPHTHSKQDTKKKSQETGVKICFKTFFFLFLFLFFLATRWHAEVPWCQGSNWSRNSDNAESLTNRPPGNSPNPIFFSVKDKSFQ